jgi:hypothetical protein
MFAYFIIIIFVCYITDYFRQKIAFIMTKIIFDITMIAAACAGEAVFIPSRDQQLLSVQQSSPQRIFLNFSDI